MEGRMDGRKGGWKKGRMDETTNRRTDREREMFYSTTHSTHFIYSYMVSDIWLRTILIVRKETGCRHIGYSYRLTARVLLYAPSHRQDNTYHSLCYTSHGALAGMRNSSMGPLHEEGQTEGRTDGRKYGQKRKQTDRKQAREEGNVLLYKTHT